MKFVYGDVTTIEEVHGQAQFVGVKITPISFQIARWKREEENVWSDWYISELTEYDGDIPIMDTKIVDGITYYDTESNVYTTYEAARDAVERILTKRHGQLEKDLTR